MHETHVEGGDYAMAASLNSSLVPVQVDRL